MNVSVTAMSVALATGLYATHTFVPPTPGPIAAATSAGVDPAWWRGAPYPNLRRWLDLWLASDTFTSVMAKHPPWRPDQPPTLFP